MWLSAEGEGVGCFLVCWHVCYMHVPVRWCLCVAVVGLQTCTQKGCMFLSGRQCESGSCPLVYLSGDAWMCLWLWQMCVYVLVSASMPHVCVCM